MVDRLSEDSLRPGFNDFAALSVFAVVFGLRWPFKPTRGAIPIGQDARIIEGSMTPDGTDWKIPVARNTSPSYKGRSAGCLDTRVIAGVASLVITRIDLRRGSGRKQYCATQ